MDRAGFLKFMAGLGLAPSVLIPSETEASEPEAPPEPETTDPVPVGPPHPPDIRGAHLQIDDLTLLMGEASVSDNRPLARSIHEDMVVPMGLRQVTIEARCYLDDPGDLTRLRRLYGADGPVPVRMGYHGTESISCEAMISGIQYTREVGHTMVADIKIQAVGTIKATTA